METVVAEGTHVSIGSVAFFTTLLVFDADASTTVEANVTVVVVGALGVLSSSNTNSICAWQVIYALSVVFTNFSSHEIFKEWVWMSSMSSAESIFCRVPTQNASKVIAFTSLDEIL
jgi:hypothetical protein